MRRTVLTILVLFVVVSLNAGTIFAKPKEDTQAVVPLEQWERNERVDKKVYKIADELEYICKKNNDDYEAVCWSPTASKLYFDLGKVMKKYGEYALPPIYEIAKDKKRSIILRILMSDALADSKNPGGVRAVIGFLLDKGESERFRVNAADMLGRIKDTTATTALIETMEDKNNPEKVRWEAAHSFVFIHDERAVQPLLRNLENDPSIEVKKISISALGAIGKSTGNKDMVPKLLEIVKGEENNPLKYFAISALGAMKEERILPLLIERVEKKKMLNIDVVIWALGNIGGPKAKKALLNLLMNDNEGIRFDAAKALIKMRDKSVIPEIEKILPTLEVYHRNMVSDSLSKLREMNNK